MFDFCVPTPGTKVPHHPDWIHEVKYDGYRLMVQRDGESRPADYAQRL
jgi:bifunctional non-homologous end joining protein LigD